MPPGLDRLFALLAVAVFGAAVLAVTSPDTRPHAAASATLSASSDRPIRAGHARVEIRADRAAVHVPAHVTRAKAKHSTRAPMRHRRPAHVTPFVPSGTGMWIYQWHRTNGGRAASIVARARHVGLSTLFLRTGSSWDGFSGRSALGQLLAATQGSSVRVVAWDFPRLRHPARDARRLARAAWMGRAHRGAHVAAVAPDIETPSEGTFNASWRVHLYLHVLRKHLPEGVSILSTVPWPSSYRRGDYPYWTVARGSDVLIPMAYWYNNPPAVVTSKSIRYLRQFHKPVQPVGQGYDGKIDVPSLHHNNLARQVPVFLRTAHSRGVHAVSIWSWQSAKPATWRALAHARRMFDQRR